MPCTRLARAAAVTAVAIAVLLPAADSGIPHPAGPVAAGVVHPADMI